MSDLLHVKQIAVAVVERKGHFLIGQRPPGVPLAGLWEFPGGKLLPGESPEAGAVRECREETGLIVVPRFAYPQQLQEYTHGSVQLHFIHCEPIHCEPADEKAKPQPPFQWVAREQLANYEFPAGNRALLAQLLRG